MRGGKSRVYLKVAQPGDKRSPIPVTSGAKPGDLNAFAAQLGERLGVPVEMQEYLDDQVATT